MKILIAGSGALGSEIAYTFHEEHKITCVDHGKNFGLLKNVLSDIEFVKGDISDDKLVNPLAKECDTIFYCIDTGGVVSCLNEPERFTRTNIDEFKKFLETIDDIDRKKFFLFSSCYVYPDAKNITENTQPNPETLYGKLRLRQEEILKDVTKNFIILRLSNIFGYGHFFNVGNPGAIEKFIASIFTGQKITLHGDGNQMVDYLYKNDLMNLLKILLKTQVEKTYNVSTGTSNSIFDIAKLVNHISLHEYGKKSEIVKILVDKKLPNSPKISPKKVTEETGWKPSSNIILCIKEMISVYNQSSLACN